MKTTFKQYLLEANESPKAESIDDLLNSIVDGHFTKDGSKLKVVGDFNCSDNELKSLWGCPQKVGGGFDCFSNQLESLEGCPQTVGGNFDCSHNQLESLEGCPQTISGYFDCYDNKQLTSLARINFYVHEINGSNGIDFTGCPIKSNVLGLLKIRNLKKVIFDDKKLQEIMNKHSPMGDSTDCIDDLLDAGYGKEYCKW